MGIGRWEIYVTRVVVEHRRMEVAAASQGSARRRALAIIRGDAEPRDGEDEGEFCDGAPRRPVVRSVTKKPVVPH